MNDIWNEICFELRACIQNNVLEKDYENAICNCMVLLGWKKFRGEIITQYPVQAGHENKYADIVVSQDGTERFVIEINGQATYYKKKMKGSCFLTCAY